MASIAAKLVAKKIFAENAGNKQGREDPFYETVPATRLGIKTTKKQKRALPPGLTREEEQTLNKVKRRAYRLDLALFSLFGLRFGWGSVFGLIPVIGDFADMLFAMMLYRTACSIDLPATVKQKMMVNIVFDFFIGLIPFLGDIMDAMYKCNTKNAILLEEHLRERGKKRLRDSGAPVMADPSLPEEYDYDSHDGGNGNVRPAQQQYHNNDSPPEYTSRQPSRAHRSRRDDVEAGVAPPQPARVR